MVITGASSGIGLATALAVAEQGAKVALLARSEETLERDCHEYRRRRGRALAITLDGADRKAMEAAADQTFGRFGRIDTWINNAGVAIYEKIEEIADEDNRRLFEANFWGVVYGSLAALPYLKQSWGRLDQCGQRGFDAVGSLQGM